MEDAKIFTKIDLVKGYFQVPVTKEDIEKTAFITCFGLYTFNYSCLGLRNSGATFQHLMYEILGNLPFCFVYFDNILIFSPNIKQHMRDVRRVLQILKENRFTVRKDKCKWAKPVVEFLGHQISPGGIKPLPIKVQAVTDFPKPTAIKAVQEFTGMISYYHRFAPNLAEIVAPKYECLKGKPKKLCWLIHRPNLVRAVHLVENESEHQKVDKRMLPCQTSKIVRHTETGIGEFQTTQQQLAHIHIDIVGPMPPSEGFGYIFTIIDRNTRWPEAIPVRQQTAESCAETLKDWVSRLRVPQYITSDREANFMSTLWSSLAASLGTKLIHTTAYNPEANGMERVLPIEWTLDTLVCIDLWKLWGKPTLDLFATSRNHRLPLFCSLASDPLAWATNAMLHNWSDLDLYAFSPLSMVREVLNKFRMHHNKTVTLVAPL
ncbi:uncharacterized protein [Macrobrachium rosenbergii]|uniref:uncharacterized protein n=1 Tax=Macrobrachium rosenbergii TaxID=79674 RepID=UPI0034D52F76